MAVLDAKKPAFQATTVPISVTKAEALALEGKAPLAIDGAGAQPVGRRLLLKDQTKIEQNGLFEVTKNECFAGEGKFAGTGNFAKGDTWALKRPEDADSSGEVAEGMLVPVEDGATNQQTSWIQRTAGPIEVGVTAQTFEALIAGARGTAGGDLKGTFSEPSLAENVIAAPQLVEEAVLRPSLGAGVRDYGFVTSLPTSPAPVKGDRCFYIADEASGTVWTLIYDGVGSLPWKYVGGASLFSEVSTEQTTTSASYADLGTTGPSITVPLKGDYRVGIGATLWNSGASATSMSYAIGGTAASDEDRILDLTTAGSQGSSASRTRLKSNLAASVALTSKYKVSGGTGTFLGRWTQATPVRLG